MQPRLAVALLAGVALGGLLPACSATTSPSADLSPSERSPGRSAGDRSGARGDLVRVDRTGYDPAAALDFTAVHLYALALRR